MKAVFASLGLGLLFTACHKHEEHPKTTAELMTNHWKIETVDEKDLENGILKDTVFVGTPADYFDFEADATAKCHIVGVDLNFTWKIVGDSIVLNDMVHFKLETLTATKMVLHAKTMTTQTDYTEVQYNLSK